MEYLRDPEELLTCPYDPAHRIRYNRMAVHLVRCKKNFPDLKMATCDFNATHHIPEPELQWHHDNCIDRKNIESQIFEPEENQSLKKYPIPKLDIPADEDWNDLNVPTYNPREYCENSNVLRRMDVASASKKKEFRMAERQRLNQLNENSGLSPASKPAEKGISLPNHRTVANINVDRSQLRDKIKLGANKVFLQYEDGPSSSK